MTLLDTPDYQRGIVSAQKLLATVTGGADTVTVTVPPNAETLIAIIPSAVYLTAYSCTGVTSGAEYPGVRLPPVKGGGSFSYVFFDISSAVDSQVDVYQGGGTASDWYVYVDAGVHITTDATIAQASEQGGESSPLIVIQVGGTDGTDLRAIRTDTNGQQFTVPVPPGTATGDHPPVELSTAYVYNGTGGNVLITAPGAGKRIRLFFVQLIAATSGSVAYLQNGAADRVYAYGTSQGMTAKVPLAGIPVPANDSLVVHASSGNVYCTVMYTIETV